MIAMILASLSLFDAERAAVAHSPAVIEARAKVTEMQALLGVVKSGGAPHAIVNYAQVPQGGATGTITQRLTTVGAQIALGDIAARNPLVAQAAFDVRNAAALAFDAERSERVKTIGLYVDVQRTSEVRRLREAIVASAQADESAAKVRYKAGDAPRLDVVRSDVALAQARAELSQARADEINAATTLGNELGVAANDVSLEPLANGGRSYAGTKQDAINAAIAARPEVAAARAEVHAEEAAVRAAHRGALPGITAQAGYTAGQDSGINVKGPSANVTLDVPISGANADKVRAEEARLEQSRARVDAVTRTVVNEVGTAYENLRASREALQSAGVARAEAVQEIQAAEIGYRNGASSSLDLADARRTYAQAAVQEVTARAAMYEASESFNLAVGAQP